MIIITGRNIIISYTSVECLVKYLLGIKTGDTII